MTRLNNRNKSSTLNAKLNCKLLAEQKRKFLLKMITVVVVKAGKIRAFLIRCDGIFCFQQFNFSLQANSDILNNFCIKGLEYPS
jgi:hypothetical protein